MRTSVRIALAGSAVLAGVAFASPALAAPSTYGTGTGAGRPTITVAAGHSATFVAGGFKPGSTVTVHLSDGRTYTATANGAGRISLSIAFGGAGNYTVTATGLNANGATRTVSGAVAVAGASVASTGTSTSSTSTTSSNDTGSLPFTGLEFGAIAGLGAATLIGGATVRIVARKRVPEAV